MKNWLYSTSAALLLLAGCAGAQDDLPAETPAEEQIEAVPIEPEVVPAPLHPDTVSDTVQRREAPDHAAPEEQSIQEMKAEKQKGKR